MTSSAVGTPTISMTPLWLAAMPKADSEAHGDGSEDHSGHPLEAAQAIASPSDFPAATGLSSRANQHQNIQLAPFRDRLTLRRQRYVPLGDRSPWQTLRPLLAGGQLKTVAAGPGCQATPEIEAKLGTAKSVGSSLERWTLAQWTRLDHSTAKVDAPSEQSQPATQLLPHLYITLSQTGDLSLRLLPICHHLGLALALSTLDGVGREFKISAQANLIQRIAQLQEMQLEISQEWAIRRSLYNSLAQAPLRPSQALRYFDRLLDESPYPPSRTPASDRLLQRRQLFKTFSAAPQSDHQPGSQPSLWDAYAAVAHWVNYAAPGSAAQRWQSCCHGPGATLLRQALAYVVALQYDQQGANDSSSQPRQSGAQRSLAASDALQARIRQLREDGAIAQLR